MRRFIHFLIISVFLIVLSTSSAQSTEQPFDITLSTDLDTVRLGSELWIKIVLRNISDKTIHITETRDAVCDYLVDVHEANGNFAPYTDFGRDVKDRDKTSGFVVRSGQLFLAPCSSGDAAGVTLKPNSIAMDRYINISVLYDLSRLGKYIIQVERYIPNHLRDDTLQSLRQDSELSNGLVKSNTITVTVTE